jgi:hypothetical protein
MDFGNKLKLYYAVVANHVRNILLLLLIESRIPGACFVQAKVGPETIVRRDH